MSVLVNIYATRRTLPPLEFPHAPIARRDRTDPELAGHLQGFMGFVMQGERPMTQSRYHVLRHIERVQNHLSFEVEQSNFDAVARWAIEANGILFLPDGTVRDPTFRILVDPETGEPEAEARLPYPPDAIARKHRHDTGLREGGVLVAATLPPVLGEDEVDLRSARDVMHRAYALAVVAMRAESLHTDDPLSLDALRERLPEGFVELSPVEQRFLDDASAQEQDIVNHVWRYEALWVLAWTLQVVDTLPDPTATCDVRTLIQAMLDADRTALISAGQRRPTAEILDALDVHLRLHWAAREAARTGAPAKDLDIGVIRERHHALNWMVRFEDAAWDDVDTPS